MSIDLPTNYTFPISPLERDGKFNENWKNSLDADASYRNDILKILKFSASPYHWQGEFADGKTSLAA